MALTGDGARLYEELAPLLDGLSALEPSMRHNTGRTTLRWGAGSSLATWWFVPIESEAAIEPPLDVRIFWTTQKQARATPLQAPLFRENIFSVCAPSPLPDGKPLKNVSALLDLPLIQKGHTPTGEWSWTFWLQKLGLNRTALCDLVLGDISPVTQAKATQ